MDKKLKVLSDTTDTVILITWSKHVIKVYIYIAFFYEFVEFHFLHNTFCFAFSYQNLSLFLNVFFLINCSFYLIFVSLFHLFTIFELYCVTCFMNCHFYLIFYLNYPLCKGFHRVDYFTVISWFLLITFGPLHVSTSPWRNQHFFSKVFNTINNRNKLGLSFAKLSSSWG